MWVCVKPRSWPYRVCVKPRVYPQGVCETTCHLSQGVCKGAKLAFCEFHHFGFCIEFNFVVGQLVGIDKLLQRSSELSDARCTAAFFMHSNDTALPLLLTAAVLAGQLVDAPVQRLANPEIFGAECQHLLSLYRPKQPIG